VEGRKEEKGYAKVWNKKIKSHGKNPENTYEEEKQNKLIRLVEKLRHLKGKGREGVELQRSEPREGEGCR